MMCTPTEVIELMVVISMIVISPETVVTPVLLPEKPELTTTTVVEMKEVMFLEDLEKEKPLHLQRKTIVKLNVADQPSLLVHHLKEEVNKLLLHKET